MYLFVNFFLVVVVGLYVGGNAAVASAETLGQVSSLKCFDDDVVISVVVSAAIVAVNQIVRFQRCSPRRIWLHVLRVLVLVLVLVSVLALALALGLRFMCGCLRTLHPLLSPPPPAATQHFNWHSQSHSHIHNAN